MAKAREAPKAPAVRFRIDPAYAPADKIARRLSLTLDQFAECRRRLYARGFPVPDETTGMYDLEAVDRWVGLYAAFLADMGIDASPRSLRDEARDWVIESTPIIADKATIYVIGFRDYVKIGITSLPVEYRIRTLQTACPERLMIYATFPGDAKTERGLHARFAKLRLNGEWFKLEAHLQRWISAGCPHG